MGDRVSIDTDLLDGLADSISNKFDESVPLTITEMTGVVNDILVRTGSNVTVSGATVSVQSGLYKANVSKTVASGTEGIPTASKGTVSNHSISITPSVTNSAGYISGSTKTGTAVTVSAGELVSGNKSITDNGSGIDVTNYATVSVNVQSGDVINNQSKTVTPTETQQIVTYDAGYTGLSTVTVNAIGSDYVGSGITRRSSSDMTFGLYGGSMPYVGAPAGYYATGSMKMITRGTEGTPTATKGTVSNHSISITPSVTNTEGYIAGGTTTGTAVTVTASELASGNKEITSNGTGIDVVGYSTVSVSVGSTINNQNKTVNPSTTQQSITADTGYTGLGTVTVNAMPTMTLPTSASSTSSGTSKATITPSSSAQYINIPTGYNGTASYYKINAASVSSTNTATIIGTAQDPDSTFVETLDGFFYQNGQTFTWTGDTYDANINSYGGTGGDIYVNGVYVATDEHYMSLPDCDVTITFVNVGTNVDNIYIDYTPTSATCEMGIYVPTTDIATPNISFRNAHTDLPMYIAFEDVSSSIYASDAPANTNVWWLFIKYACVSPTEIGVASTSTQTHYGIVRYGYRSTTAGGSLTSGGINLYAPNSNTGTGTNYPRNWTTSTAFTPSSGSSTRYWRAGHAFKWIAIWPPET